MLRICTPESAKPLRALGSHTRFSNIAADDVRSRCASAVAGREPLTVEKQVGGVLVPGLGQFADALCDHAGAVTNSASEWVCVSINPGATPRGGADAQQFTVTDTQVAEHSRRAAAIEKHRVLDQYIEYQQAPGLNTFSQPSIVCCRQRL
jgi:hypothetical protein